VQVIGEKEGKNMKKDKINYTDAPLDVAESISAGEIITDFLPPPEKLIRKEAKVKITISLNSGNIDFFKKHAEKNNVKYQTMINEVLDRYVQTYREKNVV
jgi:predicted DNA binding CopG/RHH family protein